MGDLIDLTDPSPRPAAVFSSSSGELLGQRMLRHYAGRLDDALILAICSDSPSEASARATLDALAVAAPTDLAVSHGSASSSGLDSRKSPTGRSRSGSGSRSGLAGIDLGRSVSRDSTDGSPTSHHGLSGLLPKSLFRKRGSISVQDNQGEGAPQSSPVSTATTFTQTPKGKSTAASSPSRPTMSLPPPLAPVSSVQGARSPSSFGLPPGAAMQPSTSSQFSYPRSDQATQARLRTLPRLDSYVIVNAPGGESDADAGSSTDFSSNQSNTESEQESEDHDQETDEDEDDTIEEEDEHDDEHDERDAHRSESAMRQSLQRPALPTLASTRGFSRAGTSTPFAMPAPPKPSQFQGWATFNAGTPTPGPLRTARPSAYDDTPHDSYFDARPAPPTSAARTPRAGSRDGAVSSAQKTRSPVPSMPPITTPGAIALPQPGRVTADMRMTPSRVSSSMSSASRSVNGRRGSDSPHVPTSAPPSNDRPAIYSRQSRSLVDLSRSLVESEPLHESEEPPIESQASTASASPSGDAPAVAAVSDTQSPGEQSSSGIKMTVVHSQPGAASPQIKPLQRRQSLPNMRIDPPIYSIDDDVFVQYRTDVPKPAAREEEGVEPLPAYTCDVHIEGYVPRKMEFLKPGVQAKDRRWKRQYIILHGTSIKVYKTDPRAKPVAGEDAPPSPGIHKADHRPSFSSTSSKGSAAIRARSGTNASVASNVSEVSSSSEKSLAWNTKLADAAAKRGFDPDVPVHVHVQDDEEGKLSGLGHPGVLLAKATDNRVIRHYTLQGAESGLAADYLKRRHVVRIRAEGEQFLIQAKDDRAVIDWIEALQAATNTALDLDVRPLPKFITLPRRRRRRPRPADASGTANANGTTASTTAGGTGSAGTSTPPNSTSGGAGQVTARTDAMNNMLAEEQENYLARPSGMVS